MRRRLLLRLPLALTALTPLARAQPPELAGAEAMRAAGRQAVALANAQKWPEAEAMAQGAEPLIRKFVTWMRLQSRGSGAGAAEIAAFALANPEWPGQDTLARRAEEALAIDPDDRLAAEWFAARAPRTLDGFQRLADALARAGEGAKATTILRNGWAEAPADPAAEPGYLDRNRSVLTPEDHWRRFDRLSLARENAAAARLVAWLDSAHQGIASARLDYAADRAEADTPERAAAAPGDFGLTLERARWLRRRDRDAEAAAAWAGRPPHRRKPPAPPGRSARS